MPKRTDIEKILIIGSGPIVIGQGCEFDYSGTQACKALREEGYRVVLINSNPATIMTDPEMADRTYIEPITPAAIERILYREQQAGDPVDALLPTLGGQTGLNCAIEVADQGILERYAVEMIGANAQAIHKAEDRTAFKNAMLSIGLDVPRSGIAHSYEEALNILKDVHLPCCIRPAYTLGGSGGGFAYSMEEFETIAKRGLEYSRVTEILVEENLTGWKEFELEVMRDRADNVVIICSIENFDPMGVHTGDSITVAPQQTLTDKEYQRMRDAAIAIIREIGVETGGSNIQFAVDPKTGRQTVIEMNPRVSRSSALASKATGFPIAKIAAKLAVGYTLDEIPNDITRLTPASFEPTIDYCVVKIPRWTFEKFPEADETLTTQMKSVGEAMSIGRTFKEAFQKGIRSMEIKRYGLGLDANDKWLADQRGHTADRRDDELHQTRARNENVAAKTPVDDAVVLGPRMAEAPPDTDEQSAKQWPIPDDVLRDKLSRPCQGRPYYIRYAMKMGWTVDQIHELTHIDPWFLDNISELVEEEDALCAASDNSNNDQWTAAKQLGYSDVQLAAASGGPVEQIRRHRQAASPKNPAYKLVDTCAAEFEAYTPYYYSSHETPTIRLNGKTTTAEVDDEIRITDNKKIIVLGGGPNRIGQGIEFDYCCVHAVMAAKAAAFETVMINSNPETVSTDYDTSDLLFFEPLTHEDVLNIVERLNGKPLGEPDGLVAGVVVQFGGQTPLNLAKGLLDVGVPIIGTTPESIHQAEDREEFQRILNELGLKQPLNGITFDVENAIKIAADIGYPVLVRPSYVLGGRAMEICNIEEDLKRYMIKAVHATDRLGSAGEKHPILIDKFLKGATEVDVDCVSDYGQFSRAARVAGEPSSSKEDEGRCIICGVMEHIEEAGIHSGDSACALPPYSLSQEIVDELKRQTDLLAKRLNVCGLMNVQYAVRDREVYLIEVNPRASRTVPFVSKATGVPWAKVAMRVMMGETLNGIMKSFGLDDAPWPRHVSVKEAVFPFAKFPGVDVILGPEMRSTGEVMGIDQEFPLAFAKAQMAAGTVLPTQGRVLISVNDADKPVIAAIAKEFADLGFDLVATTGTRDVLSLSGIDAELVSKTPGEDAPYLLDMIEAGRLDLLVNTPLYIGSAHVEGRWRAAATIHNTPLITTITGARAAAKAIRALKQDRWDVKPLQEYI
jgi:carbamoyl-phosphate synthase large subunit